MQAISGETYEFQAKPQVVKPKPKYRQPDSEGLDKSNAVLGNNIMYDKKVVRGNTYAASTISKHQDKLKKETKTSFKKPLIKNMTQGAQQNNTYANVSTPKPLPNRHNIEIQTEEYVETLTDKPPEQEVEAQTDFYIDKPPVRLFTPRKYGIDQDTQVYDGELFDFDSEVEPILQVLMNKTLEQARMEVLEEEELKLMKEQQKKFEKIRNAEMAEVQRLEAVQKRLDEDEARRRLQYETAKKQANFSHQKLISRLIAKNLLKNLKNNTFNILEDQGVFRNPLVTSLYDNYLPWLYQEVREELMEEQNFKQILNQFLDQITLQSKSAHQDALDSEAKRKSDVLKKREKAIQQGIQRKEWKSQWKVLSETLKQKQDNRDKTINDFIQHIELTIDEQQEHDTEAIPQQIDLINQQLSEVLGSDIVQQLQITHNPNHGDEHEQQEYLKKIRKINQFFQDYDQELNSLNEQVQQLGDNLKK